MNLEPKVKKLRRCYIPAMEPVLNPLNPILTAQLFPKIEEHLIKLLESLTPEAWDLQTIAPKWRVKDVVAHLLDTQLRKLSFVRDGCHLQTDSSGPDDIVSFVNRLNDEGVRFYGRLSPKVLVSLMERASQESSAFHQSLDPYGQATFSVSWAGEEHSANWFDTAREFTERWHHQQQIRLAVGREGIMTPELYYPVLDCFMRALPYHYRMMPSDSGTWVKFTVSGACGGDWFLYRTQEVWQLVQNVSGVPSSLVRIPQEIAWRVFTKGISTASAAEQIEIEGDPVLGAHVLKMLTIVG